MKRNHAFLRFTLHSKGLHICGLVLLAAGCVGSIIQQSILGVGQISNTQLLQVLQEHPGGMALASAAVVSQVLEICAVPIFAFLLTEGAAHTANYKNYFLRVLCLAVICEVPYHLMIDGTILRPGSLNPVFGAALCLVMLYFFRTYQEKSAAHMGIKAVAVVGTFLWCNFLGAAFGGCCVIFTAVLWSLRGRQNMQLLCGCFASVACSVFSPLYLFSPVAFLAIYLYDGRRGSGSSHIHYLGYPAILIVGLFLSQLMRHL